MISPVFAGKAIPGLLQRPSPMPSDSRSLFVDSSFLNILSPPEPIQRRVYSPAGSPPETQIRRNKAWSAPSMSSLQHAAWRACLRNGS